MYKPNLPVVNDRNEALEIISEQFPNLFLLGEDLKRDKALLLEIIKADIFYVKQSPPEFFSDKSFMIEVVKQEQIFIRDVSPELLGDRDIWLTALKAPSASLEWAARTTSILRHASEEIKDDVEVVLAAVQDNPIAIQYASKRLQGLCEGKDVVQTLENMVLNKTLMNDLPPKNSTAKNKI